MEISKKLEEWFDMPHGKTIAQWEAEKTSTIVGNTFGFVAIQLGMPFIHYLESSRMRSTVILTEESKPYHANHHLCLCPNFATLPFQNNSVDLAILPHTLEYCTHPQRILAEIDRILVHDGRVVILGFTPHISDTLKKIYTRKHAVQPLRLRYFSKKALTQQFGTLSFKIEKNHCYQRFLMAKKDFLLCFFKNNPALVHPCSVYLLSFKKQTVGMHLVGSAIQPKKIPQKTPATVTQQKILKKHGQRIY